MDVTFASNRVFKLCTKDRKRAKKLGHQRADELRVALDELDAATNLAEIGTLIYRDLHALKGDQKGSYSIDIDRQYRVWFTIPDEDELRDEHGSLDYGDVTAVEIFYVGDPHD